MHCLVQLSDLHILPPGRRLHDQVDTAAMLRAAVETLLRLPQPPAAVLLSGDLVDDGSAAAYAHLRELLAPLPCPLLPLAGNHDEREALRAAFADQAALQGEAAAPFLQYEQRLPGLRVLALDTVTPGAAHGELCPQRLAWLAQALQRVPEVPVLLAMHHPPCDTGLLDMDSIALRRGRAELAALLAAHPQVQRVVCGHLHRMVLGACGGRPVISAPSTAHQIAFAPGLPEAAQWTLEPPGLLVHLWSAELPLCSHLLHVGPAPVQGPA